MEFRFACDVMRIPTILAVVGTNNQWRMSEVGLLSVRNQLEEFSLQQHNEITLNALVDRVVSSVPAEDADRKPEEEKKTVEQSEEEKQESEEKIDVSFQVRQLILRNTCTIDAFTTLYIVMNMYKCHVNIRKHVQVPAQSFYMYMYMTMIIHNPVKYIAMYKHLHIHSYK